MSGLAVLGLLWAAVGVYLARRWWSERAQPSGHHVLRGTEPRTPGPSTRFGQLSESRAVHRRQAMRLAYAAGTSLVAVGFLSRAALPLALGAALVNLGTLYRYLVLLLDESSPDEPILAGPAPAHRRARRPLLSRALLGEPAG